MKRFILIGFTLLASFFAQAQANDSIHTILTFKIDDEINPAMNRHIQLALKRAKEENADLVLIHMNTYGGALQDADEIRQAILNFDKPVWVFIDKNAASAGALISISCDSIYMTPGSSIGAATVVTSQGDAAPDKYQSYMRSIMRATAEENGRDPHIAEAMVDQRIAIDSITQAGKVITFSADEAIKYGFCEGKFNTENALLAHYGLENATLVPYEKSASESIISFFLNPIISGILILIILGGLYFEMQTPGVGFPLAASLIALALYLTPYYLNGLAQNWEIAALIIGIVLIGLEIFVIPGFGIAGISGIILTVGGMILIMVNNQWFDFSFVNGDKLLAATLSTLLGMMGAIIVMLLGSARLANSRFFEKIALQTSQKKEEGYNIHQRSESFIGKEGTVYSKLRPSGKIEIEGDIYDAFTRGEYLDVDTAIVVIDEIGSSLRVKEKPAED